MSCADDDDVDLIRHYLFPFFLPGQPFAAAV
jgi:hypothetical protein